MVTNVHIRLLAATLALCLAPTARATAQAEILAIEGALVHTMEPGAEVRVATILIEDGVILAVGPNLEVPAGAERLDATGKHIVPALIDAYVNFDPAHDLLYTIAGIGLVRDIGGDHTILMRERDPERRARALGPDLLTAGALLDGDPPSSAAAAVLRDPVSAEVILQVLLDPEVDFFSVYLGLSPEVRLKVLEIAKAQELSVWGPRPRDLALADSIAEGMGGYHSMDALLPTGLDWEVVQPPAFTAGTQALADAGVPLIPLFYASALRLENQAGRSDTEGLLSMLGPNYSSWWQRELDARAVGMNQSTVKLGVRVLKKQVGLLLALHEAGVKILPGSGAPQPWIFPGRSLHQEMESWTDAGIPPVDVLYAATRRAAEELGVADRYGSIAAGRVASLIVCPGDPRERLATLREAEHLVVRGRLLAEPDIDDLLSTVSEAAKREREFVNADIKVPAPPVPPGAVVVLEGIADTMSYGVRMWREHFLVARTLEDRLLFLGRVAYPPGGDGPSEMLVSQTMSGGQLESAMITLKSGETKLFFEGLWTAESWRMRRKLGVESMGTTSLRERPVVVDVGSVTTLLVLGQSPLRDRFPVITLHQALEPEAAMWRMELDDNGDHQVRTHVGRQAFRLDEVGAPVKGVVVIGAQMTTVELLERDAFGGAGLPLMPEKRAAIRELEQKLEEMVPGDPGAPGAPVEAVGERSSEEATGEDGTAEGGTTEDAAEEKGEDGDDDGA